MDKVAKEIYEMIEEKVNGSWEIEKAYRQGFSHGYEAGIKIKEKKAQDQKRKEILNWRNDPFNLLGAPGTVGEKSEFPYESKDLILKLKEYSDLIDKELNDKVTDGTN